MKNILYGVYGASGFGREVIPLARSQLRKNGIDLNQLVFIDDKASASTVNGFAVLSYASFMDIPVNERHVTLAIADSEIRSRLYAQIHNDGNKMWDIRADNVVVLDDVERADGAILCPFVTLTSNIKIGRSFHANIYSYVAHDCVIGDFVTFAPGVKCNGNVHIQDNVYVGTGAIIKQGKPGKPIVIESGAVIGMGAVVTKSVSAGETVIGNPAKPLSREALRK